ncbi:MAG: hypothetical protein DWQ19_11625 [Crenarchaeota archaeon]|nr:MAG: hypothetical protein DWQ19_11625 [Thermoproteota archaeon]
MTKNNESTIEKCLSSVDGLGKIIIVDLGSNDKTLDICKRSGCEIFSEKNAHNRSNLRNKYLKNNWNLYLQPYEFLTEGHEEILEITTTHEPHSFLFKVVQDTIITKEIRLWNKQLEFTNPIYEKVQDKDALETESVALISNQHKIDFKNYLDIITQWKAQKPLAVEPYYYHALTLLLLGNYKEFVDLAEYYLFRDQETQASIMMRYHLAMVQAYQFDEFNKAIKNILFCILMKPNMAEFWCLLGDIHYILKSYGQAREFYENAMILGSQRYQSDRWPIDVVKYKKHPLSMMESINKLTSEFEIYRQSNEIK